MTNEQFLAGLSEILMTELAQLTPDAPLDSFSGWDSMGQVAIVGFLDEKLQLHLPAGTLQKCRQIKDLVDLAKDKLSS